MTPVPPNPALPDAASLQQELEQQTRDGPASRPIVTVEQQKARGIGFGIELIRAILDGRKTQTRRLIRPQPFDIVGLACPIARAGELRYVREPWLKQADGTFLYAAVQTNAGGQKFRPGMYMPRAAARLWLRVNFVRAERLQAMSASDLADEGLPPGQTMATVWDGFYTGPGEQYTDNPWVWVIGFSVER